MIEEQGGIYSANRGSKRIRRQPKRYIDEEASYQSSEEQEVENEKPGRRSNKPQGNRQEEKDASSVSQDQFSHSGSGQEDSNESSIAPVVFADVFKSKKKSSQSDGGSSDDLAHQASDSDGMSNIDEIEDYNENAMEREQATESHMASGQNGGASVAYPNVNSRAPRQAQIAGQKRTHKLCQMEKRSNDDDDEDFGLSDSSADGKKRQRSKPEGNQGYGGSDSFEEDVEIIRPTKARSVIDTDYMKQITANTFVEEKRKRVSNRRNGVEGASASQKLNSSVMQMITTDQKKKAVTQKEFEQRVKDEGIKGCFEKHEARAVKQILNMPQPDKKSKRHLDTTCLMSWWASLDDPELTPFDSEVPYQQARKECPRLLVEYFQRRTKLI